jgi:hypothetical protein
VCGDVVYLVEFGAWMLGEVALYGIDIYTICV